MKIEVWSDVVCPFCYIGKRRLESALSKFEHKDEIKVVWKSFQLNPEQKTNPSISTLESLAASKGWSLEQAGQITAQVAEMAKNEGLEFDFHKAVVANTKNAHRLIHLAKESGLGSLAKERLLKAYFTDGLNIDDFDTLASLGEELGLDRQKVEAMLESRQYEDGLNQDMYESRLIGVRGVPFFVFDRKFAISGAQPIEVFEQTIEKAWSEFAGENSTLVMDDEENDFD